ncbi:heme-binding protein [Bacteriovorax sp. PP10]|uniref:Heme-binding protein n=1 Tax=Bacteriovorax antarcticus TaxID=3088717 RepID=A0ABU5VWG8_9BACT|nr:heme-binding protein [Bacteriovorax sp. PP10]MEA9357316.1 heme-binding protein [Bacteriovorax sp. PP10]
MEPNNTESEKLHPPIKEKFKSIPETFGIRVNEEPIYNVLKKDGDFEVRHYPKQLIAKITLHGMSYDYFREHAFEKLAAYIFEGSESKKNEQLPMTDPILQHEDPNGAWTMSFILPKEYTLATAPKPKNPEIMLEEVEPYNAAVVTYSGNNKLSKIEEHKKELGEWVKKQNELAMTGHFFIAQYDAPFVVPHLKRNEVQVKVNTVH